MPKSSRTLMDRVKAVVRLFPNAPKTIRCKVCEMMFKNPFVTEGNVASICAPCLKKHPARKATKKKRKTRSDKGKKRKRT